MVGVLKNDMGRACKADTEKDILFAQTGDIWHWGVYYNDNGGCYCLWHDNIGTKGWIIEQISKQDLSEYLNKAKILDEEALGKAIEWSNT
jgi:hypothetical protein